jgi:hypothetical protein
MGLQKGRKVLTAQQKKLGKQDYSFLLKGLPKKGRRWSIVKRCV